jgi:hypothetical protein
MNLFEGFPGTVSVSETEVSSWVWRLGGRHLGRPPEGALEEPKDRARFLRARVRRRRAS